MNFYSIEYNSEKQKVMFYRNLGQSVPSVCRKMVTAPLSSNDEDPFGNSGKNFSGSTVMLHNLGSKKVIERACSKYKRRSVDLSKRKQKKIEEEHKVKRALEEIAEIYPQCKKCLYHFKNVVTLNKHKCSGPQVRKDAISLAMCNANTILGTRDFSVGGQATAVISTTIGLSTYASFEGNFFPGWAHCRKNMHPQLTTRVEEFIAKCWQEGESKIVNGKKVKSRLKISAEAVQSRLVAQYEEGQLRLSEVPVIGQVRLVYQRIGQSKSSLKLPKKRRKKSSEDGIKFQKVCRSFGEIQWGSVNLNLLKVPELNIYLQEHKLKKSGKKHELVERIERHMHK